MPTQVLEPTPKFPMHHLKNIDQFHQWCLEVPGNPVYAHTLVDMLYNVCLVFEEATPDYRKANGHCGLDKLGRCFHQ